MHMYRFYMMININMVQVLCGLQGIRDSMCSCSDYFKEALSPMSL
jgi:hypothetical protein